MGLYREAIIKKSRYFDIRLFLFVNDILGHRLLLNRASLPWQRTRAYIILKGRVRYFI